MMKEDVLPKVIICGQRYQWFVSLSI